MSTLIYKEPIVIERDVCYCCLLLTRQTGDAVGPVLFAMLQLILILFIVLIILRWTMLFFLTVPRVFQVGALSQSRVQPIRFILHLHPCKHSAPNC
jgi:hypothetical protein